LKAIKTRYGQEILVDDEDYDSTVKYRWKVKQSGNTCYAVRNSNKKEIRLHRVIANAKKGEIVDHIDGNGLNNQKSNLRICTQAQNQFNRKKVLGKSKYKGVYNWHSKNKNPKSYWVAHIRKDGEMYSLGCFRDQEQAAIAYDQAASILFKDFATINISDSLEVQKIIESMSPKQLMKLELNKLKLEKA